MPEPIATLEKQGDVSIITMDDGKANVFSYEMSSRLNDLLDQVPTDGGSLVIVGKAGVMSGGFDLNVINGGDAAEGLKMRTAGFKLLRRIFSFPRPVLIACTGHSIALGAFLLLCADYRIGLNGDYRIGANEVMNNMTVPLPILEIAKTRIPKAHWYRAMLSSEIYPIDEAIEPGYLDEIVAADRLIDATVERAQTMAALGHPYYQTTKELDQNDVLERIDAAISAM